MLLLWKKSRNIKIAPLLVFLAKGLFFSENYIQTNKMANNPKISAEIFFALNLFLKIILDKTINKQNEPT